MRDLDVGYLGVVVDDRDPQTLFDQMVAAVQARNPGWTPHNAALEVMILEAFAVAVADWIYATNRTVGALLEAVIAQLGVARDEGAPAHGALTLTFDGTVDTTVTEGTEFVADDGTTLLVVRDTPVAGSSVVLDVQEAIPGAGALLGVDDTLSPVVGIPRLSTCTLTTSLAGGRPAEDDQAFLSRSSLRLRRVSNALARAEDYTSFALEDVRVGRATAINRWDADTETETGGHVTVALYGRGEALPAEVLAELTATIGVASVSSLTVHVIDAEIADVDIDAGITVAPGYDETATIDHATAVLTEWLGWNNSGFGQTVTPDAIEAILGNIPGVSAALTTTPSGDIAHDLWQLPAPGTITVHT